MGNKFVVEQMNPPNMSVKINGLIALAIAPSYGTHDRSDMIVVIPGVDTLKFTVIHDYSGTICRPTRSLPVAMINVPAFSTYVHQGRITLL